MGVINKILVLLAHDLQLLLRQWWAVKMIRV